MSGTAEKQLKELSAKADLFESISGRYGNALFYTLSCVNATYDSRRRTSLVKAPSKQQKCFASFRAAFGAFCAAAELAAKESRQQATGTQPYDCLFDLSVSALQKAAEDTLDGMSASGGNEIAAVICRYETSSPDMSARSAVTLTVCCPEVKESGIPLYEYAQELMSKSEVFNGSLKNRVCLFADSADKFEEQLKKYGNGICYTMASANVVTDSSGKINVLSLPALQSGFYNFDSAIRCFLGGLTANFTAAELLRMSTLRTAAGPSQLALTSVFGSGENAASVCKEAAEGRTVCLCICEAGGTDAPMHALISLFACLPQ